MFKKLIVALFVFSAWTGSAQAMATLVLSPDSRGSSAGFGYQGLYLGGNFNNTSLNCGGISQSQLTHPCTNWSWDNVTM